MEELFDPGAIERQLRLLWYSMIGFMVLVMAGVLVLIYFHAKDQFGLRIARKQMLLTVLLLVILVAAVIPLVYFGERLLGGQSFISILNIGLSLGLWILLPISFIRDRRAGAILLDLGPFPYRALGFITAGIWLLMTLGTLFSTIPDRGFTIESASELLIRLSIGIISIFNALRRVQIRERGVQYGAFVAWNRILAYGWEPIKPDTLNLQVRSWFPLTREVNIPLPEQHRHDVETLLAQHVRPAAALRQNPAT